MRTAILALALALPAIPLTAAEAAPAAAGQEVSRFHLKDGRVIDGIYDKERGILVLTGKIKMELAVKPEDIVKSELLKGVVAVEPAGAGGKPGGKAQETSQAFTVQILADFERTLENDYKTKAAAMAAAKKTLEENYKKNWASTNTDWEKQQAEQKKRSEQNEQLQKSIELRTTEANLLGKRWAFSRAVRQSLQKYSTLHESLMQSPTVVWKEDAQASFTTVADQARSQFALVLEKEAKAQEAREALDPSKRWDAKTVRRELAQQKAVRNELASIYFNYYSNLFINTRMSALGKGNMEVSDEQVAIINDYVGFHRRIVDYCKTNQRNVDPRILDVFVGVAKLYFPALKQAPPQDFRAVITDYRDFVDSVPTDIGVFDPSTECTTEYNRMRL